MKVILLGATGMVGQGALRECLRDARVETVLALGRHPTMASHPKLRELLVPDLADLSAHAADLSGWDACLDCLGTTAATANLARYRRVTHDLNLSIARFLLARNPGLALVYVSAAGADARSLLPWMRVKGETEDSLRALPFRAAVMLRPALIRPLHGIRARAFAHRAFYAAASPILPLLARLFPGMVTTTEAVGRAMLHAASVKSSEPILETWDINRVARGALRRDAAP